MGLLPSSIILAQGTDGVAEVERVIVTGSNIPTAEEVGPNPVDTYRPSDIEKLGVRNATDFLTRLPQQMGATANQNGSDGYGTNTDIGNTYNILSAPIRPGALLRDAILRRTMSI